MADVSAGGRGGKGNRRGDRKLTWMKSKVDVDEDGMSPQNGKKEVEWLRERGM